MYISSKKRTVPFGCTLTPTHAYVLIVNHNDIKMLYIIINYIIVFSTMASEMSRSSRYASGVILPISWGQYLILVPEMNSISSSSYMKDRLAKCRILFKHVWYLMLINAVMVLCLWEIEVIAADGGLLFANSSLNDFCNSYDPTGQELSKCRLLGSI